MDNPMKNVEAGALLQAKPAAREGGPGERRAKTPGPARSRGKTIIDDEVVSVIARIAAEQISGVYRIGSSTLRNMLSRLGRHPGIDSEVGIKEAAIDVEIVVEFGHPIRELAEQMREQIIETVEAMTGQTVVEVNIFVSDVHVPKIERRSRRELE